jgi:crotonobetainyl-CoA hydratase
MSGAPIIYEKRGRLAYVRINRPEAMNALNTGCHTEMRAVFEDFRDDPEVWVAILTGTGDRAFCAGADLKETAARTADGTWVQRRVPFGGITGDFDCPKPIIAAVNGIALGGGTELVLACDLAIAAEHAQFGLTEPRVGVISGAGGLHRLARQIPLKDAMGMILTGRRIPAAEAHQFGLINEIVSADRLLEAAERWAAMILECSPTSVRLSKEAVLRGLEQPSPEAAMAGDEETFVRLRESVDFREGPRAFADKRKPQWTGR